MHVFEPGYAFVPGRAYTPGTATVDELRALHARLGIGRVVIVQPSPYGADNACTLAALERIGATARGVAVIDAATPDPDLRAMHAAGVRGLRVNLETPGVKDAAEARRRLIDAAARAAPLGWHVQTHAAIGMLAALEDAIAALPVPLVVDHFGRPRAGQGPGQPGYGALLALVRAGKAWVKLSAPHRIGAGEARPFAEALAAANPDRLVWGSDWPHPAAQRKPVAGIEPFDPIDDAAALSRLRAWLPGLFHRILVENPARLYDF